MLDPSFTTGSLDEPAVGSVEGTTASIGVSTTASPALDDVMATLRLVQRAIPFQRRVVRAGDVVSMGGRSVAVRAAS